MSAIDEDELDHIFEVVLAVQVYVSAEGDFDLVNDLLTRDLGGLPASDDDPNARGLLRLNLERLNHVIRHSLDRDEPFPTADDVEIGTRHLLSMPTSDGIATVFEKLSTMEDAWVTRNPLRSEVTVWLPALRPSDEFNQDEANLRRLAESFGGEYRGSDDGPVPH